jgi:carbonic anhydrase
MRMLKHLLDNNVRWSRQVRASDPDFFLRLSKQQAPEYLWIGCSDSRVPANQIVGLDPGELFVHRNVANVVVHTDLNCLSVIQFAVDVLRVKHIIVCGHYDCGGVVAALNGSQLGLIENWLRHIQDVRNKHFDRLNAIDDLEARANRLCELNVIDQVANVCRTTIVQEAWRRNQRLAIHGWIYGLSDGLLRDLKMCVTHPDEIEPTYAATLTSSDVG